MSLATLAQALCVFLTLRGALGMNMCEEWTHHPFARGITCCKHQPLTAGISEEVHWKECIHHPKNEKENYTTSMWRVYTCSLKKALPKGEDKITLEKFAELMTANYPDDIQEEINDKVKAVGKSDGKTKSWLTEEVKLTDYPTVDKLRADYFNIEKKICGGTTEVPKEEETGKKWDFCSTDEEEIHRGADCCLNTTLPFVDHHHNPYQDFKSKTCAKTLQKKWDKLGLKDKADKATFMEECNFACYLIEKKHIKIDQLVKLRVKDTIETDKIVKQYVPVYLSEAVQKKIQKHVKTNFNKTYVMEDLVPNTMLGDKADNDELYGCYAYAQIDELAKKALFTMCHPNFHLEDDDY